MNMISEIEKILQVVAGETNFRYVNYDGKNFYLEGLKSIICIENDKLCFQLKNKVLSVEGQNLKLKYVDNHTCVVAGDIKKVEVL